MNTDSNKIDRMTIARDWLPRYTGMPIDGFGDYILLTNFDHYINQFAARFDCEITGQGKPMQARPEGVLFLGKCGGLKDSTEIGHFILPIAAVRGEGTGDDYFPPEVPALPSFKLHKFVSERLVERDIEYRTGVIYTTNRRLWEHDDAFRRKLEQMTCIGIDMETATLFLVGHYNEISRGALLLVSDVPTTPEGVKTEASDEYVTSTWVDMHLDIGIDSMTGIGDRGEQIRHFRY